VIQAVILAIKCAVGFRYKKNVCSCTLQWNIKTKLIENVEKGGGVDLEHWLLYRMLGNIVKNFRSQYS
jgi:hypothetical protein